MKELAIVGAGSWGTALAIVLAPRFEIVRLWSHSADLAVRLQSDRVNDAFLPGFELPPNVQVFSDLATVVEGAAAALGVMPSRHARQVYSNMLPFVCERTVFVSATKGLEHGTLLRMSQVLGEVLSAKFAPRVACLSGPTFAREVARGAPAAVVIASEDRQLAAAIQRAFSGPTFRLYTNADPIGVEIGAALKNVIAIGAGICHGMGLGNNSIAALITRGLAEITRLAVAMAARPETLAGLAGLGDLVLTCTGELSRNRALGVELARGRPLQEIVSSMTMVAEGVETIPGAIGLAERFRVNMPITEQMDSILRGGRSPRDAIRELMDRKLKDE